MADWIPIVTTLPRDRDVYALMRVLRCKRHAAIGLMVDWLCWLDSNSTDGETGMLDEDISEVLGWPGAAEALSTIGWVSHDEHGYVVAVDFAKYNGESAKKRVEAMSRKRWQRSRGSGDACHNNFVTPVTESCDYRREEKRGEDTSIEVGGEEVEDGGLYRPPASAAPTPSSDDLQLLASEGFRLWLESLRDAMPPLARLRQLPADSKAAAADAYRALPDAGGLEMQTMLKRYYSARKDAVARFGVRDYRPRGVRSIFRGLHDILEYAQEFCERDDVRQRNVDRSRREREQLQRLLHGEAGDDAARDDDDAPLSEQAIDEAFGKGD